MKKTLILFGAFVWAIVGYSQNPTLFKEIKKDGNQSFPSAISVSGTIAIVSSGWEDTSVGSDAGAAYVYEYDGSKWSEVQRITSPEAQANAIFGQSVATNGKYIVITEPGGGAEKAYIFKKDGSKWVIDAILQDANNTSEIYGVSCAVDGETVVIGSGSTFAGYCDAIGSAYVYEKKDDVWKNTAILTPPDGQPHDDFAESISIDDSVIAVGARKAECYVGGAGYVCLFKRNNDSWEFEQKLVAPDGFDGDRFGSRVSLQGKDLVVSSTTFAVYYFEKETSWVFKQKIASPSADNTFGIDLSLKNNTLLIGAYTDDEGMTNLGAVYLYKKVNGSFTTISKIIPEDQWENRKFGMYLDLNNSFAFISGGYHTGILDIYQINNCIYYDTVIIPVYDTVSVYDTIPVYDTISVYDTIPVYDSIAVTDTLIIDAVLTGVNPPDNINTLKVYPNPAKDHLYINTGDYTRMNGYWIKIINTSGTVVFNTEITEPLYEIDLSSWTGKGLYYIQVIDSGGRLIDTRKIVLQ